MNNDSPSPVDAVFATLCQGHASGRLAHAYLVCGHPRREGIELANKLADLVLSRDDGRPDGDGGLHHPDLAVLEPVGKGRVIRVDDIRQVSRRMATTSYSGGWKVAILLAADRMNDAAANAFLKMLEEPPAGRLFLLVTDAPHVLLPTIQSRCHRLLLPMGGRVPDASWVDEVIDILAEGPPLNPLAALGRAASLEALLKTVRKEIEEEETEAQSGDEAEDEDAAARVDARVASRVREIQADMLSTILLWQRDVLLATVTGEGAPLHFSGRAEAIHAEASRHTVAGAQALVAAVDDAIRRIARNLPVQAVFEVMCFDQGRAYQAHRREAAGT